ncbi:MAG: sensor histidine kinase [Actinomycetota bacterium]
MVAKRGRQAMRPFDRFTSIRAKLGAAIVIAVAVTILVLYGLLALTLPGSVEGSYDWASGLWGGAFDFLGDVWWLLLAAGGLAALAALAFVRVLARGMTTPLRQMSGAASRMARGDYSERVTTSSRDEVGRLAAAFNRMATELEGMERLRRDLIANVSHELKTPIAAIRAHLENLLEGVEQPDRETIEVMLRQSERLSLLVEQVLDLSRLESGTMPLQPEPVALRPLADQVIAEVSMARRDHGVRIDNQIDEPSPAARADRQRVHQVLYNVLDNAVRLTPAGGRVAVAARSDDGTVRVDVDDTGPGIAPERLGLVFERFYRADSSRSRSDGGAGLGLAIARSIVEAHNGTIWAEPRAGGGARFSFTLPAADPGTKEAV